MLYIHQYLATLFRKLVGYVKAAYKYVHDKRKKLYSKECSNITTHFSYVTVVCSPHVDILRYFCILITNVLSCGFTWSVKWIKFLKNLYFIRYRYIHRVITYIHTKSFVYAIVSCRVPFDLNLYHNRIWFRTIIETVLKLVSSYYVCIRIAFSLRINPFAFQ